MNENKPNLTLALDCDSAIALVQLCLFEKGLYAKHDFELISTCATFTDPHCPHQPDQPCNCQVITMQIYGRDLSPVFLVFHSHDSSTEIFYMDEESPSPELSSVLQQVKLDEQLFRMPI